MSFTSSSKFEIEIEISSIQSTIAFKTFFSFVSSNSRPEINPFT